MRKKTLSKENPAYDRIMKKLKRNAETVSARAKDRTRARRQEKR